MTVTNPDQVPSPSPISSHLYDRMKDSAQFLLPALATLYFTLATLWNWPEPDKVVATIAAVNVFVGVLVKILSIQYNNSDAKYDGEINVTTSPEGVTQASLELKNYENPADVVQQSEVLFKVNDRQD